jgi:fused signal recognition particle receptor
MFGIFSKDKEGRARKIAQKELEALLLTIDDLESRLIDSDIDYDIVEELLELLPSRVTYKKLREVLIKHFSKSYTITTPKDKPFVDVVVGVNGAGKTTTIAKLATLYKKENRSVLFGASDTFRAAAIEQLKSWADRLDVEIVATKQGHDPSSVAFDSIQKALSKKIDNVIIDTAGRLHTDSNLGKELQKIIRICDKSKNGSPHRKLIVLDGTQSSSAFNQVEAFDKMIGLDGIIVSKLDGTASGGAIFSILKHLNIPILYIGLGEKEDDLEPFVFDDFIDKVLENIYVGAK